MERSNLYTICFALILCLVSSTALTFVSKGLEDKKNLNLELDRKKNVLMALGFVLEKKKAQEIVALYKKNIHGYVITKKGSIVENKKPQDIDPEKDNGLLPMYRAVEGNNVLGYVIPLKGSGLWGMMYGYFALENDLTTVKGITFYKHVETPGLGGEVESDWFRNNFIGKKIVNSNGELVSIEVIKGKVDSSHPRKDHCVDGISGATMTSDFVTKLLKNDLKRYENHFINLKN